MKSVPNNLFAQVKKYINLSRELSGYLDDNPDGWSKFQDDFNRDVNSIYSNILTFERENVVDFETKIYRFRRIFEKRYRHYFLRGDFIRWSYDKPFGYAGDFRIIDEIYKNKPRSKGFDRLWDNYFQQLAVANATRERKEDFKRIISDFMRTRAAQDACVMNLASGPAREIKEMLCGDNEGVFSGVSFDCYDIDTRAISYASDILKEHPGKVNFFQKNAIRLALKKDITTEISRKYDIIYSTGLFDYLDAKIAARLIANLRRLLNDNGLMIIANMRDRYENPSVCWMEWVADWNLIYRSEGEFFDVFLDAGFSPERLKVVPQRSKIMQYCFASD